MSENKENVTLTVFNKNFSNPDIQGMEVIRLYSDPLDSKNTQGTWDSRKEFFKNVPINHRVISIPEEILRILIRELEIGSFPHPLKNNQESTSDKLEQIFELQGSLMRVLACHPEQIRNWAFGDAKDLMVKICWAMVREIVEACDYLPWRWWNKHKNRFDHDKFKAELIDCQHFLTELAILGGIKPQEYFDAYCVKNKTNVQNALEEQQSNV